MGTDAKPRSPKEEWDHEQREGYQDSRLALWKDDKLGFRPNKFVLFIEHILKSSASKVKKKYLLIKRRVRLSLLYFLKILLYNKYCVHAQSLSCVQL